MPESKIQSCESWRRQLIELLLESNPVAGPLADHLAACSSCRSFWATLRGVRPALAGLPDLYTPGLRYRTLERLAGEAEPLDRGFRRLLIPVSILSLLYWFAIPLMLMTWLFDYWLARPWFSLLFSTFLLTSLGFLVGCLAILALTQGKGAEQLKVRMKDVVEGFHA